VKALESSLGLATNSEPAQSNLDSTHLQKKQTACTIKLPQLSQKMRSLQKLILGRKASSQTKQQPGGFLTESRFNTKG